MIRASVRVWVSEPGLYTVLGIDEVMWVCGKLPGERDQEATPSIIQTHTHRKRQTRDTHDKHSGNGRKKKEARQQS